PRSCGAMSALYAALPLFTLATSLLAAILILALGEARQRARTGVNMAAAIGKILLVGAMLWGVLQGDEFVVRLPLGPGMTFLLEVDALSLLFITLSAVLWLFTTVYAIGYLEHAQHRARFFAFFS